MADVAADLKTWSTTAASNSPADATTVGSGLADNLQEIQKVVRQDLAHKGADIASAGTTDLGAVVGFMHDITGTTTITSFGTVSAGIHKRLQFDGALQITHNATSLICPGGANITTYAGLCIDLVSLGSGNWIITSQLPGMVLLGEQIASSSSELDFESIISSAYNSYIFEFQAIVPATDLADLWMRVSNDNGATYSTTAYNWRRDQNATQSGTDSDTKFLLAGALKTSTGLWGQLKHIGTSGGSFETWHFIYVGTGFATTLLYGGGYGGNVASPNAVRFMMSSGNIASGTIRMYGMRK